MSSWVVYFIEINYKLTNQKEKKIMQIIYTTGIKYFFQVDLWMTTRWDQDPLHSIIAPHPPWRSSALEPLPTQPLTGIKMYMSIKLNIYLLYWYFQQNQCLNIKTYAVHNIKTLAIGHNAHGTLGQLPTMPMLTLRRHCMRYRKAKIVTMHFNTGNPF